MVNTVLLSGKGVNTAILFAEMQKVYDGSTWTHKQRWWQNDIRHELRIQNLPAEEIDSIKAALDSYWRLDIKMQVF